MKLKKNIAISETGFVFNPSSGDSFSTNPIGIEIINLMKQEKTEEEIKAYLLENYDIDNNTIEKDFYDFKQVLKQLTLLESND